MREQAALLGGGDPETYLAQWGAAREGECATLHAAIAQAKSQLAEAEACMEARTAEGAELAGGIRRLVAALTATNQGDKSPDKDLAVPGWIPKKHLAVARMVRGLGTSRRWCCSCESVISCHSVVTPSMWIG